MENKTKLSELYISFFKVGLFTFGGGLAMLPVIEKEVVNKKGWATYEDLIDYYAISQTTPGIIMVNVSTIIGYKKRKIIGAIISTLGVVTPSLIIITLIATLIQSFASYPIVQAALKGVGAGVCGIVVVSLIKFGKSSVKDIFGIILCLIGFAIAYFTELPILFIVVLGALLGIIRGKLRNNK